MPDQYKTTFDRLIRTLSDAAKEIKAIADGKLPDFTDGEREKRDRILADIAEALLQTRHRMDPAKHDIIAITLGRPDALSRFFAFSFVEKQQMDFQSITERRFYGSGVYALYYTGKDIEPYQSLSGTETPIYVGKAVPAIPTAETAYTQGPAIWNRLKEHRRSISAGGLRPEEFRYRYAVIQSGMESAVEDYMIRLFQPIWNKEIKICFGIGKHGDAAKTRGNKRSPWDTMHPGRAWAEATAEDQDSRETIIGNIVTHFARNPPIADKRALHELLAL